MRFVARIISGFLLCFFTNFQVSAGFRWTNPDSTFKMLADSVFYTGTGTILIEGIANIDPDSTILGGGLELNGGILTTPEGSLTTVLTGNFTQEPNGLITLNGGSLFIEFGDLVFGIQATGTGNEVRGSVNLEQDIILFDANTTLSLNLDRVFTHTIFLNGGQVWLEANLTIGGGGRIVGPGLIASEHNYDLAVSGTNGEWQTPLTFRNLHSITLNSPLAIESEWTFEGQGIISGSGYLLLLKNNGKIKAPDNSHILLNNVTMRNVTNGTLVLGNNTEIRFVNSTMQLEDHFTMTEGGMYVEGVSTFLLGANNLDFDGIATLTIDGALWLDRTSGGDSPFFGMIGGHDGFLSYIGTSTLREITDQNQINTLPKRFLLAEQVKGEIPLMESMLLDPRRVVRLIEDTHISGNGSVITASPTGAAQFIIPFGKTLSVDNLGLKNISNSTFSIAADATLALGQGVEIELREDVAFLTGNIVMTGTRDVCYIKGVGGRKKLTIAPQSLTFFFGIGSNSLVLEDIELEGLENIDQGITGALIGSIALLGTSVINIAQSNNTNILVEGPHAGIRLLDTNITLSGTLLFGDAPTNVLNVSFALPRIVEVPSVNFGNNFAVLRSASGLAGMVFQDAIVAVNNLGANSIEARDKSFIGGHQVNINNFPINQTGANFALESGLLLTSDNLLNPIEISLIKAIPHTFDSLCAGPTTAYQLSRADKIYPIARKLHEAYIEGLEQETRSGGRVFSIPIPHGRVRHQLALSSAKGDFRIEDSGKIFGYATSRSSPFSVHLTGNAGFEQRRGRPLAVLPVRLPTTLVQASDDTFDGIKGTDKIYITGPGNKMVLSSDFSFLGEIDMAENSELTIEMNNGMTLQFGSPFAGQFFDWTTDAQVSYGLNIPQSSVLTFKGDGVVKFSNGSIITFGGPVLRSQSSYNPSGGTATRAAATFNDARPELVVKDLARLELSDHSRLDFTGSGIVRVQNQGEIVVNDGRLRIGQTDQDFFDLIVERKGVVRAYLEKGIAADHAPQSVISFSDGFFNVEFDRESRLRIGDGGLLQLSRLGAFQTNGFVNTFNFQTDASIEVTSGGKISFGDNKDIFNNPQTIVPIFWDNLNGLMINGGSVEFLSGSTTGSTFVAQIQNNTFVAKDKLNINLARKLANFTPSLILATDYIDQQGVHKVLTSRGVTVVLQPGDTLVSESAVNGNVFGKKANGQQFKIQPDGRVITFF